MSRKNPIPDQAELKAIRKAAMAGDPAANCRMGDFHSDGQEVLPHNLRRALRYYRKAAEGGLAEGQHKTAGLVWQLSKPGPEELDAIIEAAEYAKKAAAQNDPIARQMLVTFWGVMNNTVRGNLTSNFQLHAKGMDPVRCEAVASDIFTFLYGIAAQPSAEAAPEPKA